MEQESKKLQHPHAAIDMPGWRPTNEENVFAQKEGHEQRRKELKDLWAAHKRFIFNREEADILPLQFH